MPQGQQDRLVTWFRELREPLRRFLRARRGVAAADLDDVAQEVFLRLLRFDRSELVEQPKAYLFKMAANVASEWGLRANQRWPHDSNWLGELASDTNTQDDLLRETRDSRIATAIDTLPPRARQVLQLHFDEGLTHDAIAQRLQVSKRVVKRDLINSYASLRLHLHDEIEAPRFSAMNPAESNTQP